MQNNDKNTDKIPTFSYFKGRKIPTFSYFGPKIPTFSYFFDLSYHFQPCTNVKHNGMITLPDTNSDPNSKSYNGCEWVMAYSHWLTPGPVW